MIHLIYSRLNIALIAFFLYSCVAHAQIQDSNFYRQQMIIRYLDSVDKTIPYQRGKVNLNDIATLDIPEGYKFMPADKSMMLLHNIWENPVDSAVLGMIVKSDFTISNTESWAFVVKYQDAGFVKDDDAEKINYDDLLKEIQKSQGEFNESRAKAGYGPIYMQGWAATPFYDKDKKVLHWAKKLQFGDKDPRTVLNYDVRVLGRKGVLSLNAVGSMDQLDDINAHIPDVLKMAKFTDGNQYKDFNPSMDKVAAYTIGGLIAGKLIAKTGLLLILLKNIKLIMLAAFGGFAAFRKKIVGFFSRKKKEEPGTVPAQKPWEVESVPNDDSAAENTVADTKKDQEKDQTITDAHD